MVHEAIRKRVGEDFIVGMRFLIDEAGPHHITFEDGLKIAAIFEASGTIDFFNAIYGRIDTELKLAVDCMPGMASAEAPFLAQRRGLQAGGGAARLSCDAHHVAGDGAARDPRGPARPGGDDPRAHRGPRSCGQAQARGEEERVRPCVGATHCMSPLRPTCIHNPSTGHEATLPHEMERAATRSAACWSQAAARPGWRPRGCAPSGATTCNFAKRIGKARRAGAAGRAGKLA